MDNDSMERETELWPDEIYARRVDRDYAEYKDGLWEEE
jgi:hypothetical protein